jgi:DNA-binding NarL/FixJ family response regulator
MSRREAARLRAVLCDDHALIRSGLMAVLDDIAGVEVVGEASDGDELVELAAELKPDLVITDVSMRRMSGLDALVLLRQARPQCKVLVLSMYDSPEFVRQAFAAGASGYVLKDSAPLELDLAIQAVRDGEVFMSPRISSQMVAQLRGGGSGESVPAAAIAVAARPRAEAAAAPLTPRQTQILELIARGRATKQIAFDLGLSVKTVETHRTMIMDRLGIRDVAGLVLYAVRQGLIDMRQT